MRGPVEPVGRLVLGILFLTIRVFLGIQRGDSLAVDGHRANRDDRWLEGFAPVLGEHVLMEVMKVSAKLEEIQRRAALGRLVGGHAKAARSVRPYGGVRLCNVEHHGLRDARELLDDVTAELVAGGRQIAPVECQGDLVGV